MASVGAELGHLGMQLRGKQSTQTSPGLMGDSPCGSPHPGSSNCLGPQVALPMLNIRATMLPLAEVLGSSFGANVPMHSHSLSWRRPATRAQRALAGKPK